MVEKWSGALAALTLPALLLQTAALAGGGINYSATDPDGTVERVVEMRALPGDMLGAMVSYTRTDGTRTMLEYAVRCEPMEYAYLGMISDTVEREPNLRLVREGSDVILNNEIRPVAMLALEDDAFDAPIRTLAQKVCS